MEEKDFLWKQIEKDIELYKFYLELLLKSAVFVFAITGGIVSYFFSNEGKPLMTLSLFIPILMNLGFFLICLFSHKFAVVLKKEHYRLCKTAGIMVPYEMSPLPNMLSLFSVLYGIVVVGIGSLMIIKIF
jgi:hypothetical protein